MHPGQSMRLSVAISRHGDAHRHPLRESLLGKRVIQL
jgi:hypothetical protein